LTPTTKKDEEAMTTHDNAGKGKKRDQLHNLNRQKVKPSTLRSTQHDTNDFTGKRKSRKP